VESIKHLIEQIPIKHDLVSSVILVGVLLGLLVVAVVFTQADSKNRAIRIFGFLLLVELLIGFDGYLCYTGLIKHTLHLNDLTEPLSLLIGPLLYIFTVSIIHKTNLKSKREFIHYLPAVLYFLSQTVYYFEPLATKYNVYTNAYHPGLEKYEQVYSSIFLISGFIKDYLRWYIIVSFGVYLLLSIKVYFDQFNQGSDNVKLTEKRHIFSIFLLFLVLMVLCLIIIVFVNFQTDLGDHYIFIFFTIINFIAAGFIMSESRFFDKSWVTDKYGTSGLKVVPKGLFVNIDSYVKNDKYYLRSDISLSDLSMQLSMPKNYISQAINEKLGKNFNDYINGYRVEEAKRRMADEIYKHYNIESIGESVGFNAKTTFYAAFKKYTHQTPAAYLKSL